MEELAADPKSGVINDQDFGYISFEPPYDDEDEGFWQMYNDWEHPEANAKVSCSLIPGNEDGPFDVSREFFLSKRQELGSLWELCLEELRKIIKEWYAKENISDPREIFFLSSLSMVRSDSKDWEVSFEAKDGHFWTFVSFQIRDNRIIGNTIDM